MCLGFQVIIFSKPRSADCENNNFISTLPARETNFEDLALLMPLHQSFQKVMYVTGTHLYIRLYHFSGAFNLYQVTRHPGASGH